MPIKTRGATLLELLLLLGIGGLMFVLGLRMYQSYQASFQIQQLRANVDQLFNAASNYYRANCANGDFAPNPPDVLSPYPAPASGLVYPYTTFYPVPINNALIAKGFLTDWFPANSYVDPSGGESGYIVQLIPRMVASSGSMYVNACVVIRPGTRCVKVNSAIMRTAQATVFSWVIQVSVKIKKTSAINAIAAVAGAECVSGLSSLGNNTVDLCPSSNANRDYVVWTRTPSYGAIIKPGVLNMPMQGLRDFTYQYTHDKNYEMNDGYSTTTIPPQAPVYYLCGG